MKNQRSVLLYTVVLLTVLTVVAVLAANLFPDIFGDKEGYFRKWGCGAILLEVIGLFVLMVRNSFKNNQINIFLALPESNQDINKIVWDNTKCFIVLDDKTEGKETKEMIKLYKSDVGRSFQVHLNQKILDKIVESGLIRFELTETNGTSWRVALFRLFDRTQTLECMSTTNLIPQNYD